MLATEPEIRPTTQYLPDTELQQIQSAGSSVLTTPGLAEFRKLLDKARTEQKETASELAAAEVIERKATAQYSNWKNGWLLRRVMKSQFAELQAAAEESIAKRTELQEQAELAKVGTQIELSDSVRATFARFSDAFALLSRSTKIWDTVSHKPINQFVERTLATRAIERKPVRFHLGHCSAIHSDWRVPHLENANGGDIFLFPLFVVYFAGEHSFALLEYKDIQFSVNVARFHEEEGVPTDSRVVGRTLAKTNKDGSPDRRFKENYEIPIAEYGKMIVQSATGLNEEYMFSNLDSGENFLKEWQALAQGIARGA